MIYGKDEEACLLYIKKIAVGDRGVSRGSGFAYPLDLISQAPDIFDHIFVEDLF